MYSLLTRCGNAKKMADWRLLTMVPSTECIVCGRMFFPWYSLLAAMNSRPKAANKDARTCINRQRQRQRRGSDRGREEAETKAEERQRRRRGRDRSRGEAEAKAEERQRQRKRENTEYV